MRHGIYICPPQGSDLADAGARWLGRDVFTGEPCRQPAVEGIEALTAAPRRYGFHATVVAPFRLAESRTVEGLQGALRAFCGGERPFAVRLAIARLGPFFALVPEGQSEVLDALASRAVRYFHPFRAEPTAAETARRKPNTLTPGQRRMLKRWHYPYVLDEFRFHMTLTGAVPPDERDRMEGALRSHFDAVLQRPFTVDALARYTQPEPGADFRVRERILFSGAGA